MTLRPPTTGTPSMVRPHLLGSSSMMQRGTASAASLVFSSRSTACPAAPAPMIMALCTALAFLRRLADSSRMNR